MIFLFPLFSFSSGIYSISLFGTCDISFNILHTIAKKSYYFLLSCRCSSPEKLQINAPFIQIDVSF